MGDGKMQAELERRLGVIHKEVTKLSKIAVKRSVSRKLLHDSLEKVARLSLVERHGFGTEDMVIDFAKGKAKEYGYPYVVVLNGGSWVFMPKKRLKESAFSDCEVIFDTSGKS